MDGNRIKISCPICGFGRLIDSGFEVVSLVEAISSKDENGKYDYYLKCSRCKKEIGIKKINK